MERSKDWMRQAERDLQNARWELQGGFWEWACFAAQQAGEKAVKAIYQRLGGEARGHTVTNLFLGLREKTEVADEVIDLGRTLDRFYIPTRYPNGWVEGVPADFYTSQEADLALSCGEEVLRFCRGLLAQSG